LGPLETAWILFSKQSMGSDLTEDQLHNAKWIFMASAVITYNAFVEVLRTNDAFELRILTQGMKADMDRYFESFTGLRITNPAQH
jgi:hypothetical protein